MAVTSPDATPFGTIGTRTGDTITIGGQSCRVTLNGKRECIVRVVGGRKHRLYLDDLLAFDDMLGPTPASPYVSNNTAGQDYPAETGQIDQQTSGDAAAIVRSGLKQPAADPIDPEPLSDAEKMDRLTAAVAARAAAWDAPAHWEGPDPLAL